MTEIRDMSSEDLCLEGMKLFSIYDDDVRPRYVARAERYFLTCVRKYAHEPSKGYYGWLACGEFLARDIYAKPDACTDTTRALAFYKTFSRLESIVAHGYADAILNGVFGTPDYDEALSQISKLTLPIQAFLLGKMLLTKNLDHLGDIDAAVLLRFASDVDPAEVNCLSMEAMPLYNRCGAQFESKSIAPEHAEAVIDKYITRVSTFTDYDAAQKDIARYFELLDEQLDLLGDVRFLCDGTCPLCLADGHEHVFQENTTGGNWECPSCRMQATMLSDGFLGIESSLGEGQLKAIKYDKNRWGERKLIRRQLFKGEQDVVFRNSAEIREYLTS